MCVCGVYTAVQKMAEAHMQHLGIYPPMENPYEREEYDDYRGREEGGTSSLKKATGEAEALGQKKRKKLEHMNCVMSQREGCLHCQHT